MATTKTTVYLTAADYRRLKALARATDRTTAELVREAVAEYARRHAPGARPKSLGPGRSGRGDVAERAEELLRGLGRRRGSAQKPAPPSPWSTPMTGPIERSAPSSSLIRTLGGSPGPSCPRGLTSC